MKKYEYQGKCINQKGTIRKCDTKGEAQAFLGNFCFEKIFVCNKIEGKMHKTLIYETMKEEVE